jgi:hypothetical protein
MWGKNAIFFYLPPIVKEIPLLYFYADYERSTLSLNHSKYKETWGLNGGTH